MTTLMAMIATVSTGKRRVGMSSFSGNKRGLCRGQRTSRNSIVLAK